MIVIDLAYNEPFDATAKCIELGHCFQSVQWVFYDQAIRQRLLCRLELDSSSLHSDLDFD